MKMDRVEHIIVGGGVIGLAVAFELAGRGRRVRVLDRGAVARGTSWAAAGILPASRDRTVARDAYDQLSSLSTELYPDWVAQLTDESDLDPEFDRLGGLHVASSRGESIALSAAANEWERDGIEVRRMTSKSDWATCEPAVVPAVENGKILSAVLLPGESVVRTPRLLKSLVAACRRRQVAINENVDITGFLTESHAEVDYVTAAESKQGIFAADQFCLASGAWSSALGAMLDWQLDLRPLRGQMLMFEAAPGQLRHVINQGPNYLVPRRDGRILVGSTVEDVGYEVMTTPAALGELHTLAGAICPDLSQLEPVQQWAGLRPGTGDGLPLIGRLPTRSNVFVTTGHFRSGVFLAPATAKVVSQLMLNESTDVELHAFRVGRQ